MDELERFEEFILDNLKTTVIHDESTLSYKFDLVNMTCHIGNRSSQKKPIRYDGDGDRILFWSAQSWKTFPFDLSRAITKLFHNFHERQLLK
jgi:hypothetical protein